MKRLNFFDAYGDIDNGIESTDGVYVTHDEALDELTKFARVWAYAYAMPHESFERTAAVFAKKFPGFRLVGDSVETCRVEEVK